MTYRNPVNAAGPAPAGGDPSAASVFRAYRYGLDFPAFEGRDLTRHGSVQLHPDAPFEFVMIERAAPGVSLRWNSMPEARYQVLFGRDLSSSPEAIAVVTAIGTETTYLDGDPLRVEQSAGFYWVQEIPTTPDR